MSLDHIFKTPSSARVSGYPALERVINSGASSGASKSWSTRKAGSGGGLIADKWEGTDHVNKNGMVRVVDGDGDKTIHTFDPKGVKHWSITLDKNAPPDLHAAALKHAKAYVDGGLKNHKTFIGLIINSGTTEGAIKGWESRNEGSMPAGDNHPSSDEKQVSALGKLVAVDGTWVHADHLSGIKVANPAFQKKLDDAIQQAGPGGHVRQLANPDGTFRYEGRQKQGYDDLKKEAGEASWKASAASLSAHDKPSLKTHKDALQANVDAAQAHRLSQSRLVETDVQGTDNASHHLQHGIAADEHEKLAASHKAEISGIKKQLAGIDNQLSPENLHRDGEASRAEVGRRYRELMTARKQLLGNRSPSPSDSPYGFCPTCKAKGVSRTRGGANAKDTCAGGHVYPSSMSLESADAAGSVPLSNGGPGSGRYPAGSHMSRPDAENPKYIKEYGTGIPVKEHAEYRSQFNDAKDFLDEGGVPPNWKMEKLGDNQVRLSTDNANDPTGEGAKRWADGEKLVKSLHSDYPKVTAEMEHQDGEAFIHVFIPHDVGLARVANGGPGSGRYPAGSHFSAGDSVKIIGSVRGGGKFGKYVRTTKDGDHVVDVGGYESLEVHPFNLIKAASKAPGEIGFVPDGHYGMVTHAETGQGVSVKQHSNGLHYKSNMNTGGWDYVPVKKTVANSAEVYDILANDGKDRLRIAVELPPTEKLTNRFMMAPDNWIHIAPIGEHPHPTGLLQVIDKDACESMYKNFNAKKTADGNFPGVLVDYDHKSLNPDDTTEAAGWLDKLQVRSDGLWAHSRWSDGGQKSVQGGNFRLVSPVWQRSDCEDLGNNRVRPTVLDSVALTNQPNLKGLTPLTS